MLRVDRKLDLSILHVVNHGLVQLGCFALFRYRVPCQNADHSKTFPCGRIPDASQFPSVWQGRVAAYGKAGLR